MAGLPRMQVLVPWTPAAFRSNHADTMHVGTAFCWDPASGEVWGWQADATGCNGPRGLGDPLADLFAWMGRTTGYHFTVALNPFFPDGTFVDRTRDGTVVPYASGISSFGAPNQPIHALNLHDPRTGDLMAAAYQAFIARYGTTPGLVGFQIGYTIYQENLTEDFGFTAEAFGRFQAAWGATLSAESRLDATTQAAVNALVSGLDAANPLTWPQPVEMPDHIHYVETPDSRARRFYYAAFQKFRLRDIAALQRRLFDVVRAAAGPDAWIFMYAAQIYTTGGLPSPIHADRFVQLGELAMSPVLDPATPSLYSLGKDEGMSLQGYGIARCAGPRCQANPGHLPYGVCPSTRGDACVCEPVENGCVDDWRLDRTIAYLRRGRAHGSRHRVDDAYVRSGIRVAASGLDWEEVPALRAADFHALDDLVFQDYARPGEPPFASRIDASLPVQVRLWFPVWPLGAIPRVWGSTTYATGRADVEFLQNLLESRGITFEPINDDWTGLSTPVVVPFHDLLGPLLEELPGYDPAKVIPVDALPIAAPSPVDDAFAQAIVDAITTKVPGLSAPIILNPLERVDPANDWEPHWVMRAGAFRNVAYNLSVAERCLGLEAGRSLRLAPFEARILEGLVDDRCR
jgi:hypothetical protein